MSDILAGRPAGTRARRKKRVWKRPAVGARLHAAAAMGDLFTRPRLPTALWVIVLASLVLHGAAFPFLIPSRARDLKDLAQEDTYLRKVIEKEKAKQIAGQVARRVTMPPPPPDPEAVVQGALSESLTGDVTKITAGLMDVKLQGELAAHIKTTLKDELDAASRQIAEGRLTEEEIQELHRQFQDKAHKATLAWREEYLKTHQVERASLSTTEWYEQDVSRTLFRNISFELWTPPGYTGHPPSPELWHWAYTGRYGWEKYLNWSDLRSEGMLRDKIGMLKGLATGQWPNAGGRDINLHPAWPGPSAEQAEVLAERLRFIHDGVASPTYPRASFKTVVYGADSAPALTEGVLNEFHPHRLERMRTEFAEPCDRLWDQALSQAEDYLARSQGAADVQALAAARDACLATVRQLAATAEGLLVKNPDEFRAVNWAIRCEVLSGPMQEQMYRTWVDEMVAGLEPLIRDFARGQFKKGIIVHSQGVDEAMKEFPRTIVPLLQRDIERMFPPRRFAQRVHETVYPFRQYVSDVTGQARPPGDDEVKAERAAMDKIVAAWPEEERAYVARRRERLEGHFRQATENVKEVILERVLSGNLLFRQMDVFVEGVDYADPVQEKLNARAKALAGRGQDLARMTADGVPDTSAPLIALLLGASKGHGANLQPVAAAFQPDVIAYVGPPEQALAAGTPRLPPAPAKWGFEEQPTVECPFRDSPRFEGIPFLVKFPRLDGDLSDWGRIRPLMLRAQRDEPSVLVYAAWNYQGLFFGYHVRQDAERFYYASMWGMSFNHNTGGVWFTRVGGVDWAFRGDYFQVLFDTLDARNSIRGEPHAQEFVIFPGGTESDPTIPGMERVIESQRDATVKEYRGVKAAGKVFQPQPPPETGPDGTGPYRVAVFRPDGYTVEVFLPRSLLNSPVFAPGWYVGFDCAVATGVQGERGRLNGQAWASARADQPDRWGDLLLLGTDPRILLQEADEQGTLASVIIPGYSYLLTIIDPDRNVNPSATDTVLVSTEVRGGGNDVEVFVLKETEANTGIFRGYINTQPGMGRQVQGVLEVMPLQEVVLGYVDFGNARGQRNAITEMRLPVVAPVAKVYLVNRRGY